MKLLTKEEFIKKARAIHGDRYDYSKVVYINNATKVIIICPIHGEFEQKPNHHLNGQGCKVCIYEKLSILFKHNLNIFIEKARKVHGNRYDYSKVVYTGALNKVIIICPIHGEFEQTASNHLNGQGCVKCRNEKQRFYRLLNTEKFISRAKAIHGDKYDYSKSVYVNSQTKVCIICPIHGEFWQTANDHMYNHGCARCSDSKGEKYITSILDKFNIIYKREYTIPDQIYKFRYDFYLPDYNLLIEFHGRQHYESIKFFGGDDSLSVQRERDMFKRELAKELKIKLVEFNYKQMNDNTIEKILFNILKEK